MDFSAQNPSSSNALNLAARVNDVQAVRWLIKKINPNSVDNRGWTCLHEAAYHDSFASLKVILRDKQVRPLVESHEGHTALYVACQNTTTTTKSIKYILKKVHDIANYGSREGFTPLHLACRQGREDVVQMLLDYGALIDVVDFDGDSPLHEACHGKRHETVNILLHAGADAEIRNQRDITPLHMACVSGSLEAVQYLVPFITDINARDFQGNTPLIAAIHSQNLELIEFLLENNADPNLRNSFGNLPLFYAMDMGFLPVFELLFKVTDKDEIDAFHVYSALTPQLFSIDVVNLILQNDFDVDYFEYNNHWSGMVQEVPLQHDLELNYKEFAPLITFLNVANYIYTKSPEKFRELFYLVLMKGLSVNASYFEEMPPLIWLITFFQNAVCFEEILEIIVIHGCDVDYCRNILYNKTVEDMVKLHSQPSQFVIPNNILEHSDAFSLPDAFMAAILMEPSIVPMLIPYSLYCDPGFVLKFVYDTKIIDRIPMSTQITLIRMIDEDCEILEYSSFRLQVPALKHLSRLKTRDIIKERGNFRKTTKQFLLDLNNLPLPGIIKDYIRFL